MPTGIGRDELQTLTGPVLFDLLDAMDGAAPDADLLFLLTINRADLLEPGGSGCRGGCRCPRWGMAGHGQRAAEGTVAKGRPGSATHVVTGRGQLATFKAGKEAL